MLSEHLSGQALLYSQASPRKIMSFSVKTLFHELPQPVIDIHSLLSSIPNGTYFLLPLATVYLLLLQQTHQNKLSPLLIRLPQKPGVSYFVL